MRTPPANRNNAGVHHEVHHRMVERHQRFRFHIEGIERQGSLIEFGDFVVLPDEGLYHTDSAHILLHHPVEGVVALENLLEKLRRPADQNGEENRQHQHRRQEDEAQFQVDKQAHRQGRHHIERRPKRRAEQHLEGTLDVAHVGRHPGHEPRRGEFVDIRKREPLDVAVHCGPQIGRQPRTAVRRESPGKHAEQEAQQRHPDHNRPIAVHLRKVPGRNPFIDERRRHIRNQYAHHHLGRRPYGRQPRGPLVLPHLPE